MQLGCARSWAHRGAILLPFRDGQKGAGGSGRRIGDERAVATISIAVSTWDILGERATYEFAGDAVDWFLHRVCRAPRCFDDGIKQTKQINDEAGSGNRDRDEASLASRVDPLGLNVTSSLSVVPLLSLAASERI